MVGITFSMTALALGFGALYPHYDTDNMAEIPTSCGGLLFMMAAVSYLGGVVILLAGRSTASCWCRSRRRGRRLVSCRS